MAAPRGLSQPSTSFIASVCQGIHRLPFDQFPSIEGTTLLNAFTLKQISYECFAWKNDDFSSFCYSVIVRKFFIQVFAALRQTLNNNKLNIFRPKSN